MIIDDMNVATYGVIVGDRSSSRSAATTKQIIQGAPGAWRRVRMGMDAPEALQIAVNGHIIGDTASDLRDNIDQLKYSLRPNKELTIAWSDTDDREWFGYRQSLRITDITPGWVTEGVRFALTLLCPDPFAHELSAQNPSTSGAVGATGLVLTPLVGTAPMPMIINITGNTAAPLVNPVLHYRDGADADIITLSLTDAGLDSTEDIVINTEFMTALKDGSNVAGNISGTYFDVDPGDGDKYADPTPTYPDIRLTSDSGSADDFSLEYKRRYW